MILEGGVAGRGRDCDPLLCLFLGCAIVEPCRLSHFATILTCAFLQPDSVAGWSTLHLSKPATAKASASAMGGGMHWLAPPAPASLHFAASSCPHLQRSWHKLGAWAGCLIKPHWLAAPPPPPPPLKGRPAQGCGDAAAAAMGEAAGALPLDSKG